MTISLSDNIRNIISSIGEDPTREGLVDTPKRVVSALLELTCGYGMDPELILSKQFDEKHKELVIVKDIPLYSMCEHHMLPFFGKVHIGYIPNGKVVGLSKLARLVNCFGRRLQVQERLTSQIADSIVKHLNPEGCMVIVSARHLCMELRGVKATGCETMTSAVRGVFERDEKTRYEFLSMIGAK